jgi:hypothetical protein
VGIAAFRGDLVVDADMLKDKFRELRNLIEKALAAHALSGNGDGGPLQGEALVTQKTVYSETFKNFLHGNEALWYAYYCLIEDNLLYSVSSSMPDDACHASDAKKRPPPPVKTPRSTKRGCTDGGLLAAMQEPAVIRVHQTEAQHQHQPPSFNCKRIHLTIQRLEADLIDLASKRVASQVQMGVQRAALLKERRDLIEDNDLIPGGVGDFEFDQNVLRIAAIEAIIKSMSNTTPATPLITKPTTEPTAPVPSPPSSQSPSPPRSPLGSPTRAHEDIPVDRV